MCVVDHLPFCFEVRESQVTRVSDNNPLTHSLTHSLTQLQLYFTLHREITVSQCPIDNNFHHKLVAFYFLKINN